jgi:CheY-specific phosphatase CheX
LEIGDEKVQIVQTMQEEVENKSRQLETNCKALGKTSAFKIIFGYIILNFNS